jgi:hypothetical protein
MAALADEFARLISALHGWYSGDASRSMDGAVYESGWAKSISDRHRQGYKRIAVEELKTEAGSRIGGGDSQGLGRDKARDIG